MSNRDLSDLPPLSRVASAAVTVGEAVLRVVDKVASAPQPAPATKKPVDPPPAR